MTTVVMTSIHSGDKFIFSGVPAPLATTLSIGWRSAGQKTQLKSNKINGMEPPDPQR